MPPTDGVRLPSACGRPAPRRRRSRAPACASASSATVFAPKLLQRLGIPIDRMAAPVEADRFLLVCQLLRLAPRRRPRAVPCRRRRSRPSRPDPRPPRRTAAPGRRCDRAAGANRARTPHRRRPAAAGAAPPTAAPRLRCPCASESKAPALVRLSNTRLFTSRRSRSSQSDWSERMRPCFARTASSDSIAPSPTFLIAVRPKRTPCGVTVNRQLALVDVRRQHRDAAFAALAEVERELVGVLRFDRQQRRGEVPRVVRLQIGRLVGEQRVRRRVRLREPVAGEVLHQVEDLRRPSSRECRSSSRRRRTCRAVSPSPRDSSCPSPGAGCPLRRA